MTADRLTRTHRQTDTLITILRSPYRGRGKYLIFVIVLYRVCEFRILCAAVERVFCRCNAACDRTQAVSQSVAGDELAEPATRTCCPCLCCDVDAPPADMSESVVYTRTTTGVNRPTAVAAVAAALSWRGRRGARARTATDNKARPA